MLTGLFREVRAIIADWLIGLALHIYPPGVDRKRLALLIKYHLTRSMKGFEARWGLKEEGQ